MAIKKIRRESIIKPKEFKSLDNEVINDLVESNPDECKQEIKVIERGRQIDEKVRRHKYENENYCSDGQYLYAKSSSKLGNIKVGRHVWAKENHYNIEDNT